ncbi:hypothetical protein M3Y99_00821600 [Aphelenchoides fujianensis]|nr:hypothetical protein M3Y99_00821600 [Aphelenchoides fujianensis]
MLADKTKGAAQLVRLASVSRARLTSVRRFVRGLKFELGRSGGWLELRLDGQALETPEIVFPASRTEMLEMLRLLDVPVHLDLGRDLELLTDAVCEQLKSIDKYVNGLTLRFHLDSAVFSAFITSMAPQLKELECPAFVLKQLPPLNLERLVFWPGSDHVLSESITSLALSEVDFFEVPFERIEAFCRRFPQLEELRITARCEREQGKLEDPFEDLWPKCLEARDRLHLLGLKRLFLTVSFYSRFIDQTDGWIEKLKKAEPFDRASFLVDPSNNHVRMFLEKNERHESKSTFFRIDGDFWRMAEEDWTDDGGWNGCYYNGGTCLDSDSDYSWGYEMDAVDDY